MPCHPGACEELPTLDRCSAPPICYRDFLGIRRRAGEAIQISISTFVGECSSFTRCADHDDGSTCRLRHLRGRLCAGRRRSTGEIGAFTVRNPNRPYAFQINMALLNVAAAVPNTGWIDADGLDHRGDRVHFDRRSLNERGRRYAQAMMQLHTSEMADLPSDVR